MAKRKIKSSTYQRRLNVAEQKRRAAIGRKISKSLKGRKQSYATRHKLKLYRSLVADYVEKQKQQGKKMSIREAQQSKKFKGVLADLKSTDPFRKLHALKETTRRDGVPDTIPVGETPSVYTEAA